MNASTCTVEVWVMVRVTIGFPRFLHHTSSTLPHAWFGLGSALGLGLLIAWCGAKTEETPPSSRLRVRVRDMLRFRVNFGVRVRVYAVWYKKGDLHLFDLTRFSTSLI